MEDRAIADEVLAALRTASQISPPTARDSAFRIADGYLSRG
jgi:hypothetical protein